MSKSSPKTIEQVYNDHVKKLYTFFYYKVLDKQTAEDLTSETFLALAEKLHTLDDDSDTIDKYLYGIARNKWNGYLREKYKRAEYFPEDIDDFSQFVEHEVESMEGMSLQDRATTFIDMLPKKQREIAQLRLIDGRTPTEIAKEIGKPTNHVKVTLRRAMRRLEELIATTKVSDVEGGRNE